MELYVKTRCKTEQDSQRQCKYVWGLGQGRWEGSLWWLCSAQSLQVCPIPLTHRQSACTGRTAPAETHNHSVKFWHSNTHRGLLTWCSYLEFANEPLLICPLFLVGFSPEQLIRFYPVIKRPKLCLQLFVVQLQSDGDIIHILYTVHTVGNVYLKIYIN